MTASSGLDPETIAGLGSVHPAARKLRSEIEALADEVERKAATHQRIAANTALTQRVRAAADARWETSENLVARLRALLSADDEPEVSA